MTTLGAVVFERAYIKRLNHLRTSLKKTYPHLAWVEAIEDNGNTVAFYLTEKVLLHATGGNGTRELRLERPPCMHCKRSWTEHQPAGEKCLFGSTSYFHEL